ncbi:hypothetical protein [Enterovirga rhinocerotis]|uniref:Uncharacterized protein n=1 Tax=Enterovirga rhinocerotis TaxID=1339210 RepID=A0A4R7C5G6_9HYPH|nr:hypothetical protein [Enterovirga rhinocerotis]TDR93804.1 hypothetical protein EV668_1071 [Enterovirga rhinocerotis]
MESERNSHQGDGAGPSAADVAKRLAQSWRGGAAQLSERGIGAVEIGSSLLAVGVEQLLAAEPAEMVAAQLRGMADQVDGAERRSSGPAN